MYLRLNGKELLLLSVNLEALLGIIYPTRAWREQKPVVTVLVDLHYQYEVLHSSHEVATDVRQSKVSLFNFNQPILTSPFVQIFQNEY